MNRSIRVVIAEDDAEQATRLKRMLEEVEPSWDVVKVVNDWPSCLACIEEAIPHLLMLDIHMPLTPPVGALQALRSVDYMPAIIVTTGDPSLALEAFDAAVVDYLVKPISMSRLAQATEKAKRHALKMFRGSGPSSRGDDPERGRRWLTAARGSDAVIVAPEDVAFFHAERKYTRLLTKEQEALIRMGITEVEKLLDDKMFVRIHRSTIVNVMHIQLIRRDEMGRLRIHLNSRPERLIVSRPFEGQFKSL